MQNQQKWDIWYPAWNRAWRLWLQIQVLFSPNIQFRCKETVVVANRFMTRQLPRCVHVHSSYVICKQMCNMSRWSDELKVLLKCLLFRSVIKVLCRDLTQEWDSCTGSITQSESGGTCLTPNWSVIKYTPTNQLVFFYLLFHACLLVAGCQFNSDTRGRLTLTTRQLQLLSGRGSCYPWLQNIIAMYCDFS